MCLEDDEERLERKLHKKHLQRKIYHDRYDDPTMVEVNNEQYEDTIAVTCVKIIPESWDEELDGPPVITKGYAVCSKGDQFNKQLGRVIATGRAWKKLNEG